MSGAETGPQFKFGWNCVCCSTELEEESESLLTQETQHLLSDHRVVRSNSCARRMSKCCSPVLSGGVGVLCLLAAVILAFILDPIINSYINSVIEISPSSALYKKWVSPPVSPHLKIYFYNVTNSEDFLQNRTKPKLMEVGPYVYSEKWKRVNVSFHENSTVTYSMKKEFYFEKSLSLGSEDDVIHTLNIPVTLAIEKTATLPKLMQLLLNSLFVTINETVFMDRTVGELLWGYDDPLINISKRYLPKKLQFPFDKFGLFYGRNGTGEGVNTVYTGAEDIERVGAFDNWNGRHKLHYWGSDQCNMINGTDGTNYPPFVSKYSKLYLYNQNLCRSLPLVFNNSYFLKDLLTHRFTPPEDVFASVSEKPENSCYCLDGPPCIGGGVFNVSACNFNSSVLLSWPHFYQADQKYLDSVEGLSPHPDKHAFYVDINPRLGVPVSTQARMQVNVYTRNSTNIKMMANMTPMVFPILWFEDGVEELNPDTLELIGMATFAPKIAKIILPLIFLVCAGILLALSAVCVWQRRKSQSLSFKSPPQLDDRGHVNPTISPENPD